MKPAILFMSLFVASLAWLISTEQGGVGQFSSLVGLQEKGVSGKQRPLGNETLTELGPNQNDTMAEPGIEDTEIIELRAMRDREASIPCGNKKPVLDGPSTYVKWLKNDKEIKYIYPNQDNEDNWPNPENIYETSCDPGLCRDPTNLIIKKVSNQDEGLYRCRIYSESKLIDHIIQLRVVDAPDTPTIYVNGEEFRRITVGPVNIGSDMNITCDVERRNTETEIYWRRDGAVTDSTIFTTYNRVQAELVLENLTRQDDKMHLECLVQTADVSEAIVRPLVIRMILPPVSINILLNGNNKFAVGVPRQVECLVSGSFPAPIVGWFLGDSLLTPTDFKVFDENMMSSILTLTAALDDNGKVLTCRAHNMLIPSEMYENKVNITVGFAPECATKRVVTVGIIKEEVETVTCTVRAVPEPFQFVWTYSDLRTVTTEGTALSKHKFASNLTWVPSDSDFGVLECRAINLFGIQKNPCLFHIIPGGPPEVPNCEISRSVASQLEVNCKLEESEKKDTPDPGWMVYVEFIGGMIFITVAVSIIGLGTQICFVKRDEDSEPVVEPEQNECFHREPDIEMENLSVVLLDTPVCSPVVQTSRIFVGGPSTPAEEEEYVKDQDVDSQQIFIV